MRLLGTLAFGLLLVAAACSGDTDTATDVELAKLEVKLSNVEANQAKLDSKLDDLADTVAQLAFDLAAIRAQLDEPQDSDLDDLIEALFGMMMMFGMGGSGYLEYAPLDEWATEGYIEEIIEEAPIEPISE